MKRYEDYVVIQAWQRDLQLPDKLEKLYAMIWNISKDGRSRMRATSSYIAEWCHCSQRHAKRMIYALEDMGLVAHEVVFDRRKGCNITEFWAVIPEDAERPEKGTKGKISWTGKTASVAGDQSDTHVPNVRDTHVPNQSDTHVPNQSDTHVPNHTGSNNSINTTRDKYNKENNTPPTSPQGEKMGASTFIPPTLQEVTDYARERGFADPEGFAQFFLTICNNNGWRRAEGRGKSILNWKNYIVSCWEPNRKDHIFTKQAAPERRTRQLTAEEIAKYFPGL